MHACYVNPEDRYQFAGISLTGWYADRLTKWGESHTSSYDKQFENCWHMVQEGGWLLDKRTVPESALVDLVVNGPMLGLNGSADCPAPSDTLLAGLSGAWAGMAEQKASNPKWRGLDKVSLPEYLAIWAEAGAKVGQRIGDKIKWADGTESDVPPCECWKGVCCKCKRLRHYVDREPGSFISQARANISGPDDHCPECKAKTA